jgi:DNA polymerase III sliding clamp (beta) subunit (PCNA family)
MKARRTDLLSALDLPCRIAGKAPLSMVNLVAHDSVLHITASDGDQNVISRCPCEGSLPSLFVRASLLLSAVDFGAEHIELSFDTALHYTSGNRKLKIPHLAEAYAFEMSKSKPTVVPVTELADAIDTVRPFASTSEHLQTLQSVHLKGDARILRVEASNGANLAVIQQPAICGDFDCIIPDIFAATISSALRLTGAEWMIADNMVGVRHSLGHYECKLMEGPYTDFESISSKYKRAVIGVISRDQWVASFRAVKSQLENKDDAAKVRLEFDDKRALVLLQNASEFRDEIEGNFDPCILHVNGRSFIRCLEAFAAEANVNLNLVDPSGFNAIELKDGFLSVLATQLRGDV